MLTTAAGPGMKPGLAQASKEYLLAKYLEHTPKRETRAAMLPALHAAAPWSFSGRHLCPVHESPFTTLVMSVCSPWTSLLPGRLPLFDSLAV